MSFAEPTRKQLLKECNSLAARVLRPYTSVFHILTTDQEAGAKSTL